MITCSKNLTLDYNHLITQIIENINKIKNSFIEDKVIIARRLFSENILIIIDMIATRSISVFEPEQLLF